MEIYIEDHKKYEVPTTNTTYGQQTWRCGKQTKIAPNEINKYSQQYEYGFVTDIPSEENCE